jgi:cell division protease FtsH
VLARALGGRVAEKVKYGAERVTTGAGDDLRKATQIARDMVLEQGMSTGLRDIVFHEDQGGMMFDRMVHDRPYSEETAKLIDAEVELLMREAARRAEAVIRANPEALKKLADALLKEETVEASQVKELLANTKLPKEAMLY